MAVANSSKSAKSRKLKPAKPSKDFPLTPANNGQWCKRIKGKLYNFGKWDDPQAALGRYLDEKIYLENGKLPPRRKEKQESDYLSILDLVASFLESKQNDLDLGYIGQRQYDDLKAACQTLLDVFGQQRSVTDLIPDDFAKLRNHLSKRKKGSGLIGSVRLRNLIVRCRQIFNFAYENLLVESPIRYGNGFDAPPKKAIRRERNAAAQKEFTPKEIHTLLKAGSDQLRAMLLLSLNGGLNPADLAAVRITDFDFETGWLDFPRAKVETLRRIPLWPETIKAVKKAIESRPTPKNETDAALIFVTKYGSRWTSDAVAGEFEKMKEEAGIVKPGYGITRGRKIIQTVAENATRDFIAIKGILGHTVNDISDHYRTGIADDRLLAVVNSVHAWLFGSKGKGGAK